MRPKLLGTLIILAACVGALPAVPMARPSWAQDAPAAAGDFFDTYRNARHLLDTKPDDAAKPYEKFISSHPDAPMAALARVLRGAILWRDGADMPGAEKEFTLAAAAAGQDAVSAAAATLGKKWLARVRMTRIARACHTYYLDEVFYPENLAQLVEKKLLDTADLRDPWGEPFTYAAAEAKYTKTPRQLYTLTAKNVDGDSSKIADILDREKTYARGLSLKGISTDPPRKVMVAIQTQTHTIEEGQTKAGLQAVLIEAGRAIICTPDYIVALSR